jgi:hypothetical protein
MLEFVSWLRFRVLEPLEVDLGLSAPKESIATAAPPSPAPAPAPPPDTAPLAAPVAALLGLPGVPPDPPTLLQDLQPSPLGPQPDFTRRGPAPSALAQLPPAAVTPPSMRPPEPPSPPPVAAVAPAPELAATPPTSAITPATSPEPIACAAVPLSDPPAAALVAAAVTAAPISAPADSPAPSGVVVDTPDLRAVLGRFDEDTLGERLDPASPSNVGPVVMASAAPVLERWILYVVHSVNWRADSPGFPMLKFDFNKSSLADWYNSQSYLANLAFDRVDLDNATLRLNELTRPRVSVATGPATRSG